MTIRRSAACALAGALLAAHTLAGPLTPPPGAPKPTGTPLARLAPGVCINDLPADESALALITAPGRYYLAEDLVAEQGKSGIRVLTDGPVTIDLAGFALRGIPPAIHGIEVTSPATVTITNGTITGWGGAAITTTDAPSVNLQSLAIDSCAQGVAHIRAEKIIHRDLAARNILLGAAITITPPVGAPLSATLTRVDTDSSAAEGVSITFTEDHASIALDQVRTRAAGGPGIRLTGTINSSGTVGSGGTITLDRCASSGNHGPGILIDLPPASTTAARVSATTATHNAGHGIAICPDTPDTAPRGAPVHLIACDLSSNAQSGLRSTNPIYTQSTTAGSNVLYGMHISGSDPFLLMASMHTCVLQANGAGNLRASRGRYAHVDCRFTDSGGQGIELTEGCLLLDRCEVTHNAADGIRVLGTLNANHSNARRNLGAGVRVTGGTVVAENLVAEHNGSAANAGGMVFLDCPAVTLRRCVAGDNFGDGFACASTTGPMKWMAPESLSHRNTDDGFDLADVDAILTDAIASGNTNAGIRYRATVSSGKIERCTAEGNAVGILVNGQRVVVKDNTATIGPAGGIIIAPGNAPTDILDAGALPGNLRPHPNIVH